MNRYQRIAEHLDRFSIEFLCFCNAKGGCACRGLAGCVPVNGGPVREHEMIKYIKSYLVPGRGIRPDIRDRIRQELSKHGNPEEFISQYDEIREGKVWSTYIHRTVGILAIIQVTGRLPEDRKLRIISYTP